jgi:hypothetical protein
MSLPPRRVVLTLIWIFILILGVANNSSSAQEGSQVRLAPIDTEDFPRLTSFLDVRTPEGEFIFGLERQNVRIIEDGSQLPILEIEPLRTGAQFVLAISPGPAFDIRDVQGISRYEYLAEALVGWANSRAGSTVDDLSIILADGPESTHLSETSTWVSLLNSYAPTGSETGPDFDLLAQALDVAADPTTNPGMGRAILFVTPLPSQDVSLGLQSLAARANQQGVKISIWLVASSELFFSQEALQLAQMAEQTGGRMFAYSGQESIPSPEDFLEGMRNTYFLAYDSQITAGGSHQVSAEVRIGGQRIASPVQEFDLEVLPPSVALISPPMEIERMSEEDEVDSEVLVPDSQGLEVLVEFSDGHVRPLSRTTLYINGEEYKSNFSEPFDKFTWDLSEITSSAEYILEIGVEDELGLASKSLETSVLVTVGNPSPNPLRIISQNRGLIAGIVVAVSGAILLFVLVLGGRLRPGFLREYRRRSKLTDPVTQPVQSIQEPPAPKRATWINRFRWPSGRITSRQYAQLVPLTDANQEDTYPPIVITNQIVTFGSDLGQADQLVDDGSVEEVHARLTRESQGVFRLSDEGSIAGTWVNYAPISGDGVILEQGDLVHIGRVGFRFIMRNPKRVRKPVRKLEGDET